MNEFFESTNHYFCAMFELYHRDPDQIERASRREQLRMKEEKYLNFGKIWADVGERNSQCDLYFNK